MSEIEKAIEIIEYAKQNYEDLLKKDQPCVIARERVEAIIDSHRITIEALKKQVPVQPLSGGKTFTKHWVYPSCGRLYWEKESINNYCDSCGQKFDLEE